MPRPPVEYGNLLRRMIAEHNVSCWLVNTGWTGGPYGVGRRMPIAWTRALLNGALSGELDKGEFRRDARFGFAVPVAAPGIPAEALMPEKTWADQAAYAKQAERLVDMFRVNFKRFAGEVDSAILAGGPVG
jgi:phosphoenolpyruvate carboxykinase (ATP)